MTPGPLPSTSGVRRALIWILAVGYGTFLAAVAFWPTPVDRPVSGVISRVTRELHERGVPEFIGYGLLEASANVALFVPVGILFGLAFPRRFWPLALLPGPAISGLIELIQLLTIEERYATLQDLVMNSIGSTIGVLLAAVLRGLVASRDERVIARYEALRSRQVSPAQTAYDAR